MLDTLLRMRVFVAVYEEGSFTAAASREHATQSGVTQHVQKLEDFFGAKFFSRGGGRVLPTPAGEQYYNACVEVLRSHEAARRAARPFHKKIEGDVLVGLTPMLTRCVLAPTLSAFMTDHPNVAVRVVEASPTDLARMARAEEIDFAVVPEQRATSGLRREAFVSSAEALVAGRHSSQSPPQIRSTSLAKMGPIKLVQLKRDGSQGRLLEDYLTSTGVKVTRRIEIDTVFGVLDLVARSDWVTVLPAIMMLREPDSEFVVQPFVGTAPCLNLYRIESSRESLSAAAEEFATVLRGKARLFSARAVPDACATRPDDVALLIPEQF